MSDTEQKTSPIAQSLKDSEVLEGKKQFITAHRINTQYEQIKTNQDQIEAYESIDLKKPSQERLESIAKRGTKYLESAAENSLQFICGTFNKIVPLYAGNVLLIGAFSNEGKSTITANVAYRNLCAKKKTLIISNEEAAFDVYGRIAFLSKGKNYQNLNEITPEDRDYINKFILATGDFITVVDSESEAEKGISNLTSSLEGVATILESALLAENKFDCILIDYYQNITHSQKEPRLNEYECQRRFCRYLDKYKHKSNAPIVVLAQLKPTQGDTEENFKDRIEGTKLIYNTATFAIQVNANKKDLITIWTVKKSRFGAIEKPIMTYWWSGRYYRILPKEPIDAKESDKREHALSLEIAAKIQQYKTNLAARPR